MQSLCPITTASLFLLANSQFLQASSLTLPSARLSFLLYLLLALDFSFITFLTNGTIKFTGLTQMWAFA